MPATVIPVTGLNLGPVGSVSQSDFPLRTPRQVKSTDTNSIAFGEPMVLNSDNTYSSVKTALAAQAGSVQAGTPLAIAAANTRTNPTFNMAGSGGVTTPGGSYAPGNIADGLTQGTINIQVNNGTPTAGGSVYVRLVANASIPAGVVGGFEAAADDVSTTGTASSGSTALTVASGTGIAVGQLVTGAGIAPGTYVSAVSGTSVTLSAATTAALSTTAVKFSNCVAVNCMKFKTGVLGSDGTAQVTIPTRVLP